MAKAWDSSGTHKKENVSCEKPLPSSAVKTVRQLVSES
jgi:hypothetical protein